MVVERDIGDKMKENLEKFLPYIGLPIIGITLLINRWEELDRFVLLQYEILLVFSYIGTVTDIKSKRIPNNLILAMFGVWVLTMMPKLFFDIDRGIILLKDSIFGFIIGGGLFLLVYIISRRGLGGGDVKFMAVTGLYTGFAGVISVMLYGTGIIAILGLILLLLKKIGRKDTMPLVPFLYIGILIVTFFS